MDVDGLVWGCFLLFLLVCFIGYNNTTTLQLTLLLLNFPTSLTSFMFLVVVVRNSRYVPDSTIYRVSLQYHNSFFRLSRVQI